MNDVLFVYSVVILFCGIVLIGFMMFLPFIQIWNDIDRRKKELELKKGKKT